MADIQELLSIMKRLREPGGCPWDAEQTFETIAPYTIEEAYEVHDAIARNDWDGLRDELGDLLLQVVYHAQMASEAQHFAFDSVVAAICDKLVRRHPHVFGDQAIESTEALRVSWDELKAREREGLAARHGRKAGVLDDVPLALPALLRAAKLQRRAARADLDDPAPGSGGSLSHEELGDRLLELARRANDADLDPEAALRDANSRYEARVREREDS